MAPAVKVDEAVFYAKTNYEGHSTPYKIGEVEDFYPETLNDKFGSAVVGVEAAVLVVPGREKIGQYVTMTGDNPSLGAAGELSRFVVIKEHNTRAIEFKFTDATGGKFHQYSLKVNAADVGSPILYSGDDYFKLVGLIQDKEVTTAIYVRDESSGVYVASGSVYFKYNKEKEEVDIVSEEDWPKQLKHERAASNKFIITLVSKKPDT
ncbi:abundant perithecial protein [Hypoxylon fuscum]|nr:abundant perithecial protein [Hypoxylon fuscum]